MFDKKTKSPDKEDKEKKKVERGSKDDWEAIKIILDQHPSLKQRVLHKIRAIKDAAKNKHPTQISIKQQRDFKLQNKKKQKETQK